MNAPATSAAAPSSFLADVLAGLAAPRKHISSKYFYDAAGDALFRQIMACPEYYPTRCEREILVEQSPEIVRHLTAGRPPFDVVELGAGDASKSVHLLRAALASDPTLTYFPIDISGAVVADLEARLPAELPGLRVRGLHGEYLPMLAQSARLSDRPKVVLFMGANIGNMRPAEAATFCCALRAQLTPHDQLLIGFDLVKSPHTILAAYNDTAGYTRAFNLNLLHRINRELGGDFDVAAFSHFPTYDPATGACTSYLVSERAQQVRVGGHGPFVFAGGETLHTEISQKYTSAETDALARAAGFSPRHHFFDSTGGFLVAHWA